MFRFPRWKIASIIAMTLAAFLIIMPSFLSKATFDQIKGKLPKWIPFEQVVLGLDLQGGAHILLEVDQNDVIKTMVGNLRDDARRIVREENVRSLAGGYGVQGRTVQFRVPRFSLPHIHTSSRTSHARARRTWAISSSWTVCSTRAVSTSPAARNASRYRIVKSRFACSSVSPCAHKNAASGDGAVRMAGTSFQK